MLKKMIAVTVAAVTISLVVSGWIVPSVRKTMLAGKEPTVVSSQSEEQEATKYIVMEYYGKIAVFQPGSLEPQQLLDTPVAVLPEEDRRLLAEGIRVQTDRELQALLEDYS